jgi:hypothetical protein
MAVPKRRWVRRPRIELDCRDDVATHGNHTPVRGGVHTTECGDSPGTVEMQGVVDFWRRQNRGLGAQILIDADGNSCLGADLHKICYAIKNANTGTVHVELVGRAGFLPTIWWLRLKQLNKLAKWMAYLNLEYGIPIVRSVDHGWAGHNQFPGNDHTDPGRWFPWRYTLRRAQQFRENGWT